MSGTFSETAEVLRWAANRLPKKEAEDIVAPFGEEELRKAKRFHESMPAYAETPLVSLDDLAKMLGVKSVYLKDESKRFGLNAFKALGSSFAIAKYMAARLGLDVAALPYERLVSDEVKEILGDITFVTATDGNHGRGVAWAAKHLGQKAVVYMPKGSSEVRRDTIAAEGADVSVTDVNYDDCVRLADAYVKTHPNSVLVQDTALPGYTDIPLWIMQGYGTMVLEAAEQLAETGVSMPTHVFIQAGVGSLAGAVQGFFSAKYGDKGPAVTVVESDLADCYYQSAKKGGADFVCVGGEMQTLMAGLACGEPNPIGWDILRNYAAAFVSASDIVAATGMRLLAAPAGDDARIVSGESGAVPAGALYTIMTKEAHTDLRAHLGLDENSVVLLFSTEGDTDPAMYREIVWEGRNAKL